MNQIVIAAEELDGGQRVRLTGRRALHICKVLHKGIGDLVRVGLLGGGRGVAEIVAVDVAGSVDLCCAWTEPALAPTGIRLLLALPRPKVLHRLFAPIASWGVEELILTNASKVERVYFDTHWLQPENYEPLLIEGLEQSGDTRLPRVRIERRLKPLVEDELVVWSGARYCLHPAVDAIPASRVEGSSPTLVAVGPEGGWTDYEVDLFLAHGFRCVTLGARILRSDIAVHGILAILQGVVLGSVES